MKRIWRGSSSAISCGCGSFTFTIMSDDFEDGRGVGRIFAPAFS